MEPVNFLSPIIFYPANIYLTCEHLVYIQGHPASFYPPVLANFLPRPNLSYKIHRRHPGDHFIFLEMEQTGEAVWLAKKKRLKYNGTEIRLRSVLHPEYPWRLVEEIVDYYFDNQNVPAIFLKDLPSHYNENLLRKYFGQFGTIVDLAIYNKEGSSKNNGRLWFTSVEAVKTTLFLKHSVLSSDPHVVIPLLETYYDHKLRSLLRKEVFSPIAPRRPAIPDQIPMRPLRRVFIRDQECLPQDCENVRFNTSIGVFHHFFPQREPALDQAVLPRELPTLPNTKEKVLLNLCLHPQEAGIQGESEELMEVKRVEYYSTKPGLQLNSFPLTSKGAGPSSPIN